MGAWDVGNDLWFLLTYFLCRPDSMCNGRLTVSGMKHLTVEASLMHSSCWKSSSLTLRSQGSIIVRVHSQSFIIVICVCIYTFSCNFNLTSEHQRRSHFVCVPRTTIYTTSLVYLLYITQTTGVIEQKQIRNSIVYTFCYMYTNDLHFRFIFTNIIQVVNEQTLRHTLRCRGCFINVIYCTSWTSVYGTFM